MSTGTYKVAEDLKTAAPQPSASNGNGAAPATAECSCGAPRHPKSTDRCAQGHVLPGNETALIHGARRERPLVSPEAGELVEQWQHDLGGAEHLTAGQRAVLRQVARAESIAAGAMDYLETSGESFTAKRPQAAIANLLSAAGTVFAGARLLGLERRQRRVPDLAEYLRDRSKEAGS